MKKALILAMSLFVFAGCSTKPGESAEDKFLKRFEGYSTMVFTPVNSQLVQRFSIKEGGRVLEAANGPSRFERAESDSVAVYKDLSTSSRLSFTSETEIKIETFSKTTGKYELDGTAVLEK